MHHFAVVPTYVMHVVFQEVLTHPVSFMLLYTGKILPWEIVTFKLGRVLSSPCTLKSGVKLRVKIYKLLSDERIFAGLIFATYASVSFTGEKFSIYGMHEYRLKCVSTNYSCCWHASLNQKTKIFNSQPL